MRTLKDKTIIVTGASYGLGKAVCILLAEQGARVIAMARTIDEVDFPEAIIKIPVNIRDLASIDAAFSTVDRVAPHIDGLINCAGKITLKSFENVTRDEIMDLLGVNLKGAIYITQEVYRRMLPQKTGHIMHILSTSAHKGRENETIYTASKWGLRGFSESLMLEAKPHGILVTSISPGGMNSEHFWSAVPGKDSSNYMNPELVASEVVRLLTLDPSMHVSQVIIERN